MGSTGVLSGWVGLIPVRCAVQLENTRGSSASCARAFLDVGSTTWCGLPLYCLFLLVQMVTLYCPMLVVFGFEEEDHLVLSECNLLLGRTGIV